MALLNSRSLGSPPYVLNEAQIGGLPTISDDVPPTVVFLVLFSASALVSVYLVEQQRRQYRRPYTIAILLFLFSSERCLTCMLRIIWAYRLVDVPIAVAAQVFMQAGVLLLYLLNLLLFKRIWVDQVPGRKAFRRLRIFLGILSIFTVSTLVMVITSIIVSVYTLDQRIINHCRGIQRAGSTYFLLFAALPIPLLVLGQLLSRKCSIRTTDFHPPTIQGSMRYKLVLVGLLTLLCLVNAGFKAGVIWTPARSLPDPAWYHSRACLYTFVFGTELCVLLLCFILRVDLVFEQGRVKEPGMLILPDPKSDDLVLK